MKLQCMICLDVAEHMSTSEFPTLMELWFYSLQEDVVSLQSKAACQAMAALLLANIHAPDLKPAITLTDLRDSHSVFWLDGMSIM